MYFISLTVFQKVQCAKMFAFENLLFSAAWNLQSVQFQDI